MTITKIARRRARAGGLARAGAINLFLIAIAVVTLIPLVYAFFASFKPLAEIVSSGARLLPQVWTFQNYVNAWEQGHFGQYLFNSVIVAVSVTVLDAIGTSVLGYLLARRLVPLGRAIQAMFAVSLFIGLGTATLYPRLVIAQHLGLSNLGGVVLVELAGDVVIHTFLVTAFCQSLPLELEDAARIDGAGLIRTFVFVVFPLLRPIVTTVALLGFQSAWNNFQVPYVFTLGAEQMRTVVVGLYALRSSEDGGQAYDLMLAGAMLVIVPVVAVFIAFQKHFIRGLNEGALKG